MENKVLFEDLHMPGGQYTQTVGTTENPRKVSLLDIIKYQEYLDDELQRAPRVLPAPLTDGVLDQIADLYTKATSIQSELEQTMQNPLIVDSEEAVKVVKEMHKKFEKIKLIIKSLGGSLDKLELATK